MSYGRGMLNDMSPHVSSEVLVGREADLAALRDALKRTRSAEPSTVLVGGEAGVGKTRLVEEFTRTAAADGARVLTGQSLELGEEGLPFGPFAAALRELVHSDGTAVLDGRESEFARLLPELGSPPDAADTRRGYLFELVASLFARLSESRPVVLVLEDLHWADRSTRDLIGFLVRSARLPGLLLIGTYRTDELHRGHPLRSFLAELERVRGVQRLEVDRLDRDGVAALLTQLLHAEPPARMVDTITERTQGNPFFIEQFALSGDPECADIPTSLRDLLLDRVDRLPETAQRVLRVAAVGGNTFGHELLARVAGVDEAALESALRAIVAAQLIVFDPDGGYEFRHALVREAVHDDLLPGEHARLHARYAEAIEAAPGLVAMGRAPAEIAHHWHAAHESSRALVAAKRAADDAGRRYAFAEQASLLERVLELWEQVPGAAAELGVRHLDLLEETSHVEVDAGNHMRALKLNKAALGDLDAESEPLRAARLLVRRGKLLYTAGTSDGSIEAREAYRLLTLAPPSAERALLKAEVAYELGGVDDETSAAIAAEAMAEAADTDDLHTVVSVTITYGRVCGGRISADEALPTMLAAAESARRTQDLPNLARALVNISDNLFELGRYEESAAAAAEGVPYADRIGVSRTTGVYLLANHAEALIALGRWDEADALLSEADRQDSPGMLVVPWLRLRARIRMARGIEGAGAVVRRSLGFLGRPYIHRENKLSLLDLRIKSALHSQDLPAALQATRTALADPLCAESARYGLPLLVTAATALDEATGAGLAVDDAAELRARIQAIAAALPNHWPAEKANAAHVAALLSGRLSDWRAAVEARRADGQRYELASALYGLATVAASAGDRAVAAEAIEEVTAIAGALGAAPLLAAAETLSHRAGLRSAAPSASDPAPDEILTAREREVLRLVAEGQSNSRIAEHLYISPKTASVHVSRIIAKLEVTNRGEAAAVARRLGLLED